MQTYFLHDVAQDVLRTGPEKPRDEAETVFGEPSAGPTFLFMSLRER
jgi:hypothetical protein